MKRLMLILVFSISSIAGFAQMDKVMVLGTEEARYEQLTGSHPQSLLEATGGDITRAFESWLEMQQAIDAYAEAQSFDLNGVKLWLHVFWSADGKIDQIGFLLRPDSRLVDAAEIHALLAGFAKQYQFPVQSGQPFHHYTGATFPTLSQRRG
ncbi:MAG: hypothetical protein R2795_10580 [Saprospiraceae bacterium]